MSCECNLVVNEVLAFMATKCDGMDDLSVIKICSSWFSEEEIDVAKVLICEVTNTKKTVRKGEKKHVNNISDIIKILSETKAEKLPIFVAKDLNRIPPVTFDHLDVSSILKTMAVMKTELLTLKHTFHEEVTRLNDEVSLLKNTSKRDQSERRVLSVRQDRSQRLSSIPTSQTQANHTTTLSVLPEIALEPGNEVEGQAVSYESQMTAPTYQTPDGPSFSKVTRGGQKRTLAELGVHDDNDDGFQTVSYKRKRPRIAEQQNTDNVQSSAQRRNIVRNRRGTKISEKLKAADHVVWIYVSRFQNDCTEKDIETYICENGQSVFTVEQLKPKNPTNFSSFKIAVEKKRLEDILKEDFWPSGIVFRTFKTKT